MDTFEADGVAGGLPVMSVYIYYGRFTIFPLHKRGSGPQKVMALYFVYNNTPN